MDRKPRDTIQTAEVNLLEFEAGGDFEIADAGSGDLDLGLHHYTRPCLSVTGCCHVLDRERRAGPGGFDLRFSPSQFDDFDLDLRNILHGGHAVYVGQCAVRHYQRSSLGQADTEAKQGHILGNLIKLNLKYDAAQKKKLLQENRRLLWDDFTAKTAELEQA
jgi:GT2 family glycosyltransferase